MNYKEIMAEIATIKDSDTENYNKLINELVNAETVKNYLGTDEGKKVLQPMIDSNFSKGLETWKSNNLAKLVDEKYKELHPEQDEKDMKISNLAKELEAMKAEAIREKMLNKATEIASAKNLPVNLVKYFIADDEKTTIANLDDLANAFSSAVETNVDNKLKNQHIPPIGDTKEVDPIASAFLKMNPTIKTTDVVEN